MTQSLTKKIRFFAFSLQNDYTWGSLTPNTSIMQLTIATTQNATVYEGTIDQVSLPTENGTLTIFKNHIPSVVRLVP